MDKGTKIARKVIVFDSKDNVATAIVKLESGNSVPLQVGEASFDVELKDAIPFGHKFAIKEIKEGSDVTKYGEAIGRAIREIQIGEHVHVHNVESKRIVKASRGEESG
jgi:altronate dehydratase small subunit